MKTLKKALSIILCLALMLSCVAGMQISASAEEETGETTSDIVISTNTECNFAELDGQEGYFADLDVYLDEATSFASLGLKVQYDSSVVALSYVSDDHQNLNANFSYETSENKSANPYTFVWYYQGNLAVEARKIAFLNFKYIGEGEISEDFTTTVVVTPFDPFNEDGNTLSLNAESFTVTFLPPVAEEETECEHSYDAADNVNFVEFTAEGIVHYENCTICGEKVVTSTDTSADAVTVAGKALNQSYVSAINVTAAGTYDIPVTQSDDLQVAYVDGDKIYANAYNANHNDDNIANGENAINLAGTAPYSNGVLTGITDTVNVTVDFTGIIMAFVPANVSKLPTANIGMGSAYDLGSSIGMLFKVNKTNLTNFESVYALIDHDAYSGNTPAPIVDLLMTDFKLDGNFYTFTYNIMASQMGDDVTCDFYGTLDGVEYLLRQKYNFSFVSYATGSVGYGGSDAEFKTLLSTMLQYGAVAQKSFLYRTDELVTDNALIVAGDYLTVYQAAETIARDEIDYVTSVTNYFNEDGSTPATADRLCGMGKGLNCESTVEIYYAVNLAKFKTNRPDADLNDIRFSIYYKEPSKTETEMPFVVVDELTIADAYKVDGDYYYFKADKIVASMMCSESKIVAQLGDYVFCESVYSVNSYNYNNYDSPNDVATGSLATLGDLCKAIATYGATARAYFDIISK